MWFERMECLKSFEMLMVVKYGIGVVKYIGEEVKKLGVFKVLLVIDFGVKKVGLVDFVIVSLKEVDVDVILFD